MARTIDNPVEIVADLLRLVDLLAPGVAHIALQGDGYALLNEAPLRARRWLQDISRGSGAAALGLPFDPPLLGGRAHARTADPETSHAAAASLRPLKLTKGRREILEILRTVGRPLTDEQIYEVHLARVEYGHALTKLSPSGARTRRAELVRGGLVEPAGICTRPGERAMTLWRTVTGR